MPATAAEVMVTTLKESGVRRVYGLPPKLTYGQIKGFTLYATRTVLSGEGSELIELTGANLRELEAE
jgi:pyruvate dehydrogenase (quinone)